MDEMTTIQISVKTKEELSKIGTMSDTYDSVISRLIKEHYNLNIQPYLTQLKESVDFPVNEEKKQISLQLFEGILSLGNDVSFTLQKDPNPKKTPLIEKRKNNIIFYRGEKVLCLVRTLRDSVGLYLPTNEQEDELPGWEWDEDIYSEISLKNAMEVIKRLYEDM